MLNHRIRLPSRRQIAAVQNEEDARLVREAIRMRLFREKKDIETRRKRKVAFQFLRGEAQNEV